jgi:enterochelin esterase-like enzyme
VDEIDTNYRTVASAEGRAIAGNSEGGWAAVNLGLKNLSEFGVLGSFSGYFIPRDEDTTKLFDGDQSLADANSPLTYLPQLQGELPAIYILQEGQQEQDQGGRFQRFFEERKKFYEENQEFAEALKARGANYEFENPSGGDHDWDFWRAYLPEFLVFTSEHLNEK